jgi:hypothetical protein
MDEARWAEIEFGEGELGDARRRRRLVELATTLAKRPTDSLPEACEDRAELKAAYRFFANDQIEATAMLASHVQATTDRLASVKLVLAVQDTTVLDYTHHPATTGLGAVNDAKHQGMFVHSTLAITPERVPLGLLAQDVWTRDPAQVGKRATRKQRPIAEKESQKWLTSVEAVSAARARCPHTRFVSVGDREADVYDLFLVDRPRGVDLLVRAAWDRGVDEPQAHLRAAVEAAPVAGTLTVSVPRKPGQPARTAELTVRFRPVTLKPPRHRLAEHLPAVAVWAVWVVETAPPSGCAPIEWLLLTTCRVRSARQACTLVTWYACRWGIEVWHKVLKSGCRIEARQLESADRLARCLTLFSVVAWQIIFAALLARDAPDLPCSVLLDPDEWQALYCVIHHSATLPTTPPTLRQAVRWIARLGGFLDRPSDGDPGPIVLWRGFQHLADHTTMYHLLKPALSHRKCG